MQALQTGVVLGGRYELGEQFLQCRFSTLHKGLDYSTRTPVVIRLLMLPIGVAPDLREQILAQFLKEADVLKRLIHRNLPRVLDTLSEGDAMVTIMEPFEGNPLDYVIDHMSVRPGQRLLARWMDQIAAALAYLHGQTPPIVYRDLTPHSVLLTPNAIIKLVDFGLARMSESVGQRTALKGHGLREFAAPEQLSGQSRTEPRTDLYALGATFYRLATGQNPTAAWDRLVDNEPLTSVAQANPALNEPFVALLEHLMALKAEDRPPSAQWVRERLAPFLAPPSAAAPAAAPEVAPSPGPPQSLPPASIYPDPSTMVIDAPLAGAAPAPAPAADPAVPPPLVIPQSMVNMQWRSPEAAPKPAPAPPEPQSGVFGGLLNKFIKPKAQPPTGAAPKPAAAEVDGNEEYPFADLNTLHLEPEIAALLPESIANRIGGLCIGRQGRELVLVVKQPEVYIYDHISYATNGKYKCKIMRSDATMVDLAMEYVYRRTKGTEQVGWAEWLEKKKFQGQDLSIIQTEEQQRLLQSEDVVRGPAVETVDRMIKEAISVNASDIHIETYEKDVVLRYRIDGILHVQDVWPRSQAAAYLKRVKILANMDIAQELLPQGGRISVRVAEKEFDLRVSCVPVADGESIVMRLLSKGAFHLTLEDLGFSQHNMTVFRRLINQPHGMVLVSGPTGSGKSTTLYSALAEINRPDRKILTVEDPIEYKMHGVVQVQVNMAPREEEKRLTFARALREFLRQDPDVILVGEIRDDETAAISTQAALTGHLLLSTIHTNDSIGIITRLRDRGIETFLLSTTFIGGMAQRLIRRICKDCKTEVPVTPALKEEYDREGMVDQHMFVGKGCQKCHDTGYRGRLAIHEVVEVSEELANAIAMGANAGELAKIAAKDGMKTLYQDGLLKVNTGVCTIEEVKRVCMNVGEAAGDAAEKA
ncbi:MAG TPA: ATPase, T2SS/T4P/T4SS family [Candidatus Xenobia bacterium]